MELLDLPFDVLSHTLHFLEFPDLQSLAVTSRKLRLLLTENPVVVMNLKRWWYVFVFSPIHSLSYFTFSENNTIATHSSFAVGTFPTGYLFGARSGHPMVHGKYVWRIHLLSTEGQGLSHGGVGICRARARMTQTHAGGDAWGYLTEEHKKCHLDVAQLLSVPRSKRVPNQVIQFAYDGDSGDFVIDFLNGYSEVLYKNVICTGGVFIYIQSMIVGTQFRIEGISL